MQTILGAGGDISTLLAKEIRNYTKSVRLVARNPKKVNDDDELLVADLTDAQQVMNAVSGSEVTYLTVGLPYDHKVWAAQWPVIMKNVIDASVAAGSKLVFFDNVYMYSPDALSDMREDAPIAPATRKGKVRAELVRMLEEAADRQGLQYIIARSADFYGPGARNGILNILVTDNLLKGGKPNWQADVDKIHSLTYTPDAAKATALLGNTATGWNQVWHLPTSVEKMTGRQLIELASNLAGKKPSWFVMAPWMIKIAGVFSGKIGELYEMQYQNDRDYFFNSEKFVRAYGMKPTPYATGIKETLGIGS